MSTKAGIGGLRAARPGRERLAVAAVGVAGSCLVLATTLGVMVRGVMDGVDYYGWTWWALALVWLAGCAAALATRRWSRQAGLTLAYLGVLGSVLFFYEYGLAGGVMMAAAGVAAMLRRVTRAGGW
ncbi:MAG: hypothetical protein ACE5IZ_09920 [Dehalococcoidia bacterium]